MGDSSPRCRCPEEELNHPLDALVDSLHWLKGEIWQLSGQCDSLLTITRISVWTSVDLVRYALFKVLNLYAMCQLCLTVLGNKKQLRTICSLQINRFEEKNLMIISGMWHNQDFPIFLFYSTTGCFWHLWEGPLCQKWILSSLWTRPHIRPSSANLK